MPVLRNPRKEAFCQAYVGDPTSAAQAYIQAGYSPRGARQAAFKLLTKADVKARIDEIRAEMAQRRSVSLDRLTDGLLQNIQDAREARQFAAVNVAFKSLGVLHGFWVEKSERKNINEDEIPSVVDSDLEEECEQLRREIAIEKAAAGAGNVVPIKKRG
jgi:phage terminase small subunit